MKATVNNSEVKAIRKSVKVNVNDGMKYIVIYEVRAVESDGKTITLDRYLDEKSAQQQVDLAYEHLSDFYNCFFIREQWVWC